VAHDTLCAAVIVSTEGSSNGLAIVSDRRLSVAALASLLLNDRTLNVVETPRGEAEVEDTLRAHRPEVVVVDGSWTELPAAINPAEWNGRTLLLLDPVEEPVVFLRAVRCGAQGYLSRAASFEALLAAVESVRTTGYYLDPMLASRILRASEEARRQPIMAPEPQLSLREREILAGIALGKSSKEIAREYAVTPKTICNHVSNIYAKLQFRHRGQLVLYAAEHGLTDLQPSDAELTRPDLSGRLAARAG
jgi:DNA-binding NarL/FixJ family response regulator